MAKPKRTRKFQLRIAEDEYRAIAQKANEAGVSVSEFFRRAATARKLPRRVTHISAQTYWELGKIGTNINQLTKSANAALKMGQSPPADPGYLAQLEELLHAIRLELAEVELLAEVEDSEEDDREAS